MEWPVTSLQWGQILHSNAEETFQRLYFTCRTDGNYNSATQTWNNTPNYIVMSTVEMPSDSHYFISELKSLFSTQPQKHPNMKIKHIITHPGEIIVIRASNVNRKILASKTESNEVFLWMSEKYKVNQNVFYANAPDMTLSTTKSDKPNYALRFAPSLLRLASASGDRIEVFDLEPGPATKR